MPIHRFSNPTVKAVFEAYPQMLQTPMSELRGHILDVGKAIAAGEPPCRRGRRIGGDREAVPAPQVTFLRHQPLAGL